MTAEEPKKLIQEGEIMKHCYAYVQNSRNVTASVLFIKAVRSSAQIQGRSIMNVDGRMDLFEAIFGDSLAQEVQMKYQD